MADPGAGRDHDRACTWTLNYAPGFTFYQRTSSRNEADQNASINFQYRLSPHVTFSATDGFQKSSNVFNQPDLASAGAVSGGAQGRELFGDRADCGPVAQCRKCRHHLSIRRNAMIGASGTFTNLHYPNQAEVPGLFDSESQGGSAFYALSHFAGALSRRGLPVSEIALVSAPSAE